MDAMKRLMQVWEKKMSELNNNEWMKKLSCMDISIENYKGFLQETYHNAGRNPQIMMFAASFYSRHEHKAIGMYCSHAKAEIAHDILALNDLKALGESGDTIINSRPLPETAALNALPIYLSQFENPVCHLGYMFHLEILPTRQGPGYIDQLKKMGIPQDALTFLEEHSEVDVAHMKMMERYAKDLIKTEKDFEDAAYGLECTATLHVKMLAAAFINGEKVYAK